MDPAFSGRRAGDLLAEARALALRTRDYAEGQGVHDRAALPPAARVTVACALLKGTVGLMQSAAWLARQGVGGSARRGPDQSCVDVADEMVGLPAAARALLAEGADLCDRVARLGRGEDDPTPANPAHLLLRRLERAL